MSFTTTTSNMGLVLPVPTLEPGPAWAAELNSAFGLVDAHDHSSGKGVLITPAGLSITSDLPINSNNLTLVRSVRLAANVSPITAAAPDLGILYKAGVDLYYNDGSGNQIRITQTGSVAGSAGTITGLPSGTASAAFVVGTGTFQLLQATSTGANIDVGSIAIRYPGSYPSPSGNYIQLQAPSSLSSGFALTLPSTLSPSGFGLLVSNGSGILSYGTLDNVTLTASAGVIVVPNSGINTAQLAALAVTTAKIADQNVTTAKIADTNVTAAKLVANINLVGERCQVDSHYPVVANTNATNPLAVIRGVIGTGGSIISGEGFTVSHGATGNYVISFTTAFSDAPGLSFTPVTTSLFVAATNSTASSTLSITNASAVATDSQFAFIAIGQRP